MLLYTRCRTCCSSRWEGHFSTECHVKRVWEKIPSFFSPLKFHLNTYEHESGGTLPTERSNKLQRTCPWLILGQCSIKNVHTTDQCLVITAFMYSCISVFWHRDLEQTFKATVKRATKTWNFFLQNCRRTCSKAMLHFLTPPFKPVLKQVNVAACCANTDFLLDKITLESRHTRELRNLLQNKFALDR